MNTPFVFRYRFWIFAAIFWTGFALNAVDHLPMGVAIAQLFVGVDGLDAPRGQIALHAVFGAGALCVVAAAALRTWATAYLNTTVVHDAELHSAALVAAGPYRYTRNPLYLGGTLLSIGFGTIAPRSGFVVIVVGVTLLEMALIRSEEPLLLAAHPESFAAYCARVPRFIPSLTPRLPLAASRPRWLQAYLGEAMFWIFALGMVLLAITLNWKTAAIVAAAGLIFHILFINLIRRRTAPPAA
ncbi:MAG TPA: methyltransferase [Gemmatimonadales bacterium]|nr:methyltransferase [Gemmatimonadales bacterium]